MYPFLGYGDSYSPSFKQPPHSSGMIRSTQKFSIISFKFRLSQFACALAFPFLAALANCGSFNFTVFLLEKSMAFLQCFILLIRIIGTQEGQGGLSDHYIILTTSWTYLLLVFLTFDHITFHNITRTTGQCVVVQSTSIPCRLKRNRQIVI